METKANTHSLLPGTELDLDDAHVVAEVFERAATAASEASCRRGGIERLPQRGQVLMTGDLHDNGLNLLKILKLAALQESSNNHLVLHEVIHGPNLVNGCDLSIRGLIRLAALKSQYPEQVHLMLGNHELSQLQEWQISKGGINAVETFNAGVRYLYHDDAPMVTRAMKKFLRQFTAAVRCDNGVFCCHSLPTERAFMNFDPDVMSRELTDADIDRGGPIYEMVWGRDPSDLVIDELLEDWHADLFIIGHQPTHFGYETIGDNVLVLSSDTEEGVALPIDLSRSYKVPQLVESIVRLSSVKIAG